VVVAKILDYMLLYRAIEAVPVSIAHRVVSALSIPEIWLVTSGMILEFMPHIGPLGVLLGPVTLILGTPGPILAPLFSFAVSLGSYIAAQGYIDHAGIFRVLMTVYIIFAVACVFAVVMLQRHASLTIKGVQPLLTPEAIISAIFLGMLANICELRMKLLRTIVFSASHPDLWPDYRQPPRKGADNV
jgi:hypothetical protein